VSSHRPRERVVTAAQMRKLAMALPAVEEKSHFEQPDFRVCGKIFAGLSRDGKRGNLKLPPEVQAMVLDAKPNVFSPAPGAWGRSGWTYVQLSRVRLAELETLLVESWRLIAPRRLAQPPNAAPAADELTGAKVAPTRRPARARRAGPR
jgi:hypothetical protein